MFRFFLMKEACMTFSGGVQPTSADAPLTAVLNYSLDCKEGHMKKIVCLFVCLHRGQKNIILVDDCH